MMFGKLKDTKQKQMVLRHGGLERPCVGGGVGRGDGTGGLCGRGKCHRDHRENEETRPGQ